MADFSISFILRAVDRASGAVKAATKSFKALGEASKKANKIFAASGDIGRAAQGVDKFASSARAAMVSIINPALDFQDEMTKVRGLTETSGAEFESLRAKALELGATIGEFTAQDVAQGMSELAIAGRSTSQVLAQLPTLLDLSTASTVPLANTIKMVNGVMQGMGIAAEDAAATADILTATFKNSTTTLGSVSAAFEEVAPIARKAGLDLKTTSKIIGLLGNASIDASKSGTALKNILFRLSGVGGGKGSKLLKRMKIQMTEVKDGVKQIRDPLEILQDIGGKISGLGPLAQVKVFGSIFGAEAVAAAAALADVGDKSAKLEDGLDNASGSLKRLTGIMRSSEKNQLAQLKSAFATVALTLGLLVLPVLTDLMEVLKFGAGIILGFVKRFPTLTKVLVLAAGAVAILATGLAALLFTISAIVGAVGVLTFIPAILKTIVVLKALTSAFIVLQIAAIKPFIAGMISIGVALAPVVITAFVLALAIGAITLAVIELVKHWDQLDFAEGLRGITESIGSEGFLSTAGELLDPRTLIGDIGSSLAPAPAGPPTGKGVIEVKVTGPGTVTKTETFGNMELAVESGLLTEGDF